MLSRLRLFFDSFTVMLICVLALGSVLPCRGEVAIALGWVTHFAVALLFFLHGAKLSREAIITGAAHWRLHLVVFLSTFAVFPLLGYAFKPIFSTLITPALYTGVLFLCVLPSTVQSSIAFTSIAKGNVPAAVCSASASSLIGIFITPALASLLLASNASAGWHTVSNIVLQLLVPFAAGQALRPVIGAWLERHRGILKFADQGSILLVVYAAFSEAAIEGLWRHVSLQALLWLLLVNSVLLAAALAITAFGSRRLGFNRADRITIVFCGSKKSLAAGIPMAKIMFGAQAGAIVLPLMLFHQIQLIVCAWLAQRWGESESESKVDNPSPQR